MLLLCGTLLSCRHAHTHGADLATFRVYLPLLPPPATTKHQQHWLPKLLDQVRGDCWLAGWLTVWLYMCVASTWSTCVAAAVLVRVRLCARDYC